GGYCYAFFLIPSLSIFRRRASSAWTWQQILPERARHAPDLSADEIRSVERAAHGNVDDVVMTTCHIAFTRLHVKTQLQLPKRRAMDQQTTGECSEQ
ncbi:unnamed protein product, partial [Phaeothamnion confervicola]